LTGELVGCGRRGGTVVAGVTPGIVALFGVQRAIAVRRDRRAAQVVTEQVDDCHAFTHRYALPAREVVAGGHAVQHGCDAVGVPSLYSGQAAVVDEAGTLKAAHGVLADFAVIPQ